MTLVDSNVFMYAAGQEHPLKKRAVALLERVAEGSVEAVIDADVLQELLHQYRALKRWKEGRLVYDTARILFPEMLAVNGDVVDRARGLLDQHDGLIARDALHAAVVEVYGLASITSFEPGLDQVMGLKRIEP